MKNCGLIFHQEVASKPFMNALIKHVNDKVRAPERRARPATKAVLSLHAAAARRRRSTRARATPS